MDASLRSFLLGLFVGLLFTFVGLAIPAPTEFASIAGILGLYTGMRLLPRIRRGLGG